MKSSPCDYTGHRERLKQRFITAGATSLADYELLELLLFYVNPRGDVKPLAKELLRRFKTLSGVLGAEPQLLEDIKGIGKTASLFFKALEELTQRSTKETLTDRPLLNAWPAIIHYCVTAMRHLTAEQFRVLYLDSKYHLIEDFIQQDGTIDHAVVYPREVVKYALDIGAANLILVHNHPSGDPTPSQADIDVTRKIRLACQPFDIRLLDHLVVGRNNHYSFKTEGIL